MKFHDGPCQNPTIANVRIVAQTNRNVVSREPEPSSGTSR
jgi:hypothetical protein